MDKQLLVTFGNPLTGTTTTTVWNSKAMKFVGLGARELQEKCDQQGIQWRVVGRDTKITDLNLSDPQVNQCDGCCAGLPVEEGIHWSKDRTTAQACTADRYVQVDYSEIEKRLMGAIALAKLDQYVYEYNSED